MLRRVGIIDDDLETRKRKFGIGDILGPSPMGTDSYRTPSQRLATTSSIPKPKPRLRRSPFEHYTQV